VSRYTAADAQADNRPSRSTHSAKIAGDTYRLGTLIVWQVFLPAFGWVSPYKGQHSARIFAELNMQSTRSCMGMHPEKHLQSGLLETSMIVHTGLLASES